MLGFEDLLGGDNQWYILIPLVILIVFMFFSKRRKVEKTDTEIASSLFFDINSNLKLMESINSGGRLSKFKIDSWQRNSGKINFLNAELRGDLADVFTLAETFNQEIEAAKRVKSSTYLSTINVDKLKNPLAKSKQGLEGWLKVNMQQQGPDAGRRGCMGGGFGG